MNTPETINIEKYAEALNNLVGMDIGCLGDSDENVNAIVEVIRAAKALENRVKELEVENDKLRESNAGFALAHLFDVSPNGDCWDAVIKQVETDTIRKMRDMLNDTKFRFDGTYYIYAENVDVVAKDMSEGKV